jgi:hypothetical protein
MIEYPATVYQQALVVLSPGQEIGRVPLSIDDNANRTTSYTYLQLNTGSTALTEATPFTQSMVIKGVLSSVPVIWESDLHGDYQDLGNALLDMKSLDEGDELQIEEPVYRAACYVAAELRAYSFPPPSVFTHGPKSVVFNWSGEEDNNLYLTVSSDRISALLTSAERIERRIEYPKNLLPNPELALLSIKSAYLKRPVRRFLSATVSEPTEFVG